MIFGIGLPKTATSSLAAMLEALGVRAWHGEKKPVPNWPRGDFTIADGCEALVESIFTAHFRLADELYPGSKFILTTRDEEAWIESVRRWFARNKPEMGGWWAAKRNVTLGVMRFHERLLRIRREEHHAAVARYFAGREGDLLVIDLTAAPADEAWRRLAEFVGRAPPPAGTPLPWRNRNETRGRGAASTNKGGTAMDFEAILELPGWLAREEAELMARVAEGKREAVEIGTLYGKSSCVLAAAMDRAGGTWRLTCVDPWAMLDPRRPHPGEIFYRLVHQNGWRRRVRHLQLSSREAAPLLAGVPCDLVYVDGNHEAAACMSDLLWAASLAEDVLVHDYGSAGPLHAGVAHSVDWFLAHSDWIRVELKQTLIHLRGPRLNDVPSYRDRKIAVPGRGN